MTDELTKRRIQNAGGITPDELLGRLADKGYDGMIVIGIKGGTYDARMAGDVSTDQVSGASILLQGIAFNEYADA